MSSIGFPLFSSLALHELSSAHASVVVGLLPAATAAWAVARAGERPPRAFWAAAAAGLIAVLAFAATQGVNGIAGADLLVLAAVALGGLGYAEGGALSRRYGGWQVICWALLLTAPFIAIPVTLAARDGLHAGADAWLGFVYVAVISMFLAFFAWYHALALGGVAKIGQVQLAQPVLTLLWAALVLGERVTAAHADRGAGGAGLRGWPRSARAARQPTTNAGGGVPSNDDRDVVQRAPLPGRARRSAEDDDVVHRVAVPVPRRQHALAPEPDPLQRPL